MSIGMPSTLCRIGIAKAETALANAAARFLW